MATTDQPPLQQLAAKAVVRRDNRVLCMQKIEAFGGQWEIPGGRLDSGEDARSGLRRELEEETGWADVRPGPIISCGPADPLPPFPPMFYLLLEVEDCGREPRLSDEHAQYAWLTGEQISSLAAAGTFNPSLARMLTALLQADASCCTEMRDHLNASCERCGESCPDLTVRRFGRGVGIPIRDGGSSYVELRFCPWCAAPLPRA